MNDYYSNFYKYAGINEWGQGVNSWLHDNVGEPVHKWGQGVNAWLHDNVGEPVHNWGQGVNEEIAKNEPNFRRIGEGARQAAEKAFQPMVDDINYVTKTIPNEIEIGRQGFYDPVSLYNHNRNIFTDIGLVRGAWQDRYSHDSTRNTDGSVNTEPMTTWQFLSDIGRNMTRNLNFDSDYTGHELESNLAALPAALMIATDGGFGTLDKSLTPVKAVKAVSSAPVAVKAVSSAAEDGATILSSQQKLRRYQQLQKEEAALYRQYCSTAPLREEYAAYVKACKPGEAVSFNTFYSIRQPQRWKEYVNASSKIFDEACTLFPELKQAGRTLSGAVDMQDAFLRTGFNLPTDNRVKLLKQFCYAYPYLSRALMRTNKGGHLNTAGEQLESFVSDVSGDFMGNGIEYSVPRIGANIVGIWNPRLGAAIGKLAPTITKAWGVYSTAANQADAFTDAMGWSSAPKFNPIQQFNIRGVENAVERLKEIPDDIENSKNTNFATPGKMPGIYPSNSGMIQ